MRDERDDKLDALLRDAARGYNSPPETPKAELWERIAARRSEGRKVGKSEGVLRFRPIARLPLYLGLAALLALGVAIGRLSAPGHSALPATGAGSITATPSAEPREHGEVAAQLAAAQHFGQVETFLTEFNTRQAAQDFPAQAKDLLSTTRLLLDSKRLTDVRTRKLLEDLELVLIQIATFDPTDRREQLDLISDGLAQSHLRTRLRNAIPAGPALRM
ncbi:MAG TPA: hypothetical protein VGP61_10465 [Gemmatimonadales bacterium]|jgi:hypothetical protein|nr:hypothetical protein [Gemmatimonadales bacterium]